MQGSPAPRARALAGAAVRHVRRERQWWRDRSELRLTIEPAEAHPYLVAHHATPTRRELAGVDPALQVQVVNRTSQPFRLAVTVMPGELSGSWSSDTAPTRSYRVYEADHVITNDGRGLHRGHNVLRRRVFDGDGVEIGDELVAENHALMMYEPFLGAGPVRLLLEG